ncbi:hypothetical protein EC991_002996 [Linnemannia zychae]|nr:hypothetical protein EC991_002996 [Linnemannia zychae]
MQLRRDSNKVTITTGTTILSLTKQLVLSAFTFSQLAAAQQQPPPDAPSPVSHAQYTFLEGKTLFIRGGQPDQTATSSVEQFFSLDLSPLLNNSIDLLWHRRNPTGPLVDFREQLPLALSNDLKTVTYFGINNQRMTWANLDDSWRPETDFICQITSIVTSAIPSTQGGRMALTDPSTGAVYVPYGAENGTQMLVYNNGVCSGSAMPADSAGLYSTWNQANDAIYLLGTSSTTSNPAVSVLWQFTVATASWTTINSQGNPASLLTGSCMASAGSKVLVFGGNSRTNLVSGSMYVFDTTVNTWKQGATSTKTRTQMTCATGGDFFLAWGGNDGKATLGDMLFYNIKTDKWVDPSSFAGGGASNSGSTAPIGSSPGSVGASNSNTSPSKSNTAMIGGIAAGVIVIIVIAGFIILRRRSSDEEEAEPEGRNPQSDINLGSLTFPDKSDAPLLSERGHLDLTKPTNALHSLQDFNYKTENLDQEGQSPTQKKSQNAYSISSLLPRTLDYDQLQHDFLQIPPVARNPQGQSQIKDTFDVTDTTSPLEQLALVQARHKETLERIRLEQQVELQMMRREWEAQHLAGTS